MRIIDDFLNQLTMYKTVLFALIVLFLVSLIYSVVGVIFYSPLAIIESILILLATCLVANIIFSKIFKAPVNVESFAITALILFFILSPISDKSQIYIFVLAGVLAMGSKYILALHKKHIFNPAAISLVILGLIGSTQVNWWVGNSYLFPVTLLLGLLVVRKVRKFTMVGTFFLSGLFSIALFAFVNNANILETLFTAIVSWPILFLGFFMLTEPQTTPSGRRMQVPYAIIVGIISGAQLHLGPIYSSPELAIVIGNVFSYIVSFKERLTLTLISKKELGPNIFEFSFKPNKKFSFLPGQYLEWTLPHKHFDSRGVRRFFSIDSSPTEDNILLALKTDPKKSSSFKRKLLEFNSGDKIYASLLSGEFTLPLNSDEKLVFIAGGIGITPFRSIIKYLLDKNKKRDIVLFYSNSNEREFIYQDLFESAKKIGLKTVLVLTKNYENINWNGCRGRLTAEILKNEVPDFVHRTYYLSGPELMVNSYKKLLKELGIGPHKIKTDYFSGY